MIELMIFKISVLTLKFKRFKNNTEPKDVKDFLNKKWDLKIPHLILSVRGGSENFQPTPYYKSAFKQGLIRIATSTGAWIITDAFEKPISKLVGKAIPEDLNDSPVIGIAPWGSIVFFSKKKTIVLFVDLFCI